MKFKKKIFIILLLLPSLVFCQKKGDNQIIVKNATLSQVAGVLLDGGYAIDKYDSSLGFLTTQIKPVGKHNLFIKINSRAKDGNIYLRGTYKVGVGEYALIPRDIEHAGNHHITYYNSKLSDSKLCWDIMQNIALKISNNLEFGSIN